MSITKDELLQGREDTFKDEYTDGIDGNIDRLLVAINVVREAYGKPMKVTSGWRPPSMNHMVKGAAPKSNHMIGLAVDISDGSGDVMRFVLANLELMTKLGFYFENWNWTPTWCHFQLVKPTSGKRIFVPSQSLPLAQRWDGKYDSKWDK